MDYDELCRQRKRVEKGTLIQERIDRITALKNNLRNPKMRQIQIKTDIPLQTNREEIQELSYDEHAIIDIDYDFISILINALTEYQNRLGKKYEQI